MFFLSYMPTTAQNAPLLPGLAVISDNQPLKLVLKCFKESLLQSSKMVHTEKTKVENFPNWKVTFQIHYAQATFQIHYAQ